MPIAFFGYVARIGFPKAATAEATFFTPLQKVNWTKKHTLNEHKNGCAVP